MQDRDNIVYHLAEKRKTMKEDITIIDNYKDLPLGDYQDILSLCRDESLEELDRQVKIISILTGKTEDEILNLPITDYKTLSGKIGFLEQEVNKMQRIAKCYKLTRFELIPVTDIKKVITAQYIDFQTFHQAGMEEHFVEILSCLLVPKGKKYNQDYDILEVQDAIRKELNVYDAISLYAFFMISCRESIKGMLTFSLQEAQKIPNKEQRERTISQIQEQMKLLNTIGGGLQM